MTKAPGRGLSSFRLMQIRETILWQRRLLAWISAPAKGMTLVCACLFAITATAAEVDQFTIPEGQPVALPDVAPVLEAEVNRLMQRAIEKANARFMVQHAKSAPRWLQPQCDQARLYDALADHLARSVIGQLESFAEESQAITRREISLQQSIYQDFFWQASPTLMWSERVSAVIEVNGVEMGTDKLGHFFTEGYSYFLATEQLERDIESGLLFGEWSESVYFGAQTTGVFSYADLVANTQGLRFWNRVLGRKTDPLTGEAVKPYIVCENVRWKQVQDFRWDGYVDNGWNESINCPALGSEDLLQRILKRDVTCDVSRLPTERYGRWASRLLNPYGHRVLPDYLQPEVILQERVANRDLDLSPDTLSYLAELRLRLEKWRRVSAATLQELKP